MANINMYPECVDIYYIDITLTPGIEDLIKSNFSLTVNDTEVNYFNIDKLNIEGGLYRITPGVPFNIYDEVRLSVNKASYKINALRIYIAKYFYNSGGIFLYNVPSVPSGVYNLGVTKINDEDFNLSTDPIVICNGTNSSISYIESEKDIYNLGEDIKIDVNLFDNDSLKVPDGKYVVKLKIEKHSV